MKPINYTPIFKKYSGQWVALKSDEKTVVAASRSASKAFKDARNEGIREPILFKVPTKSVPYIGIV